MKKEKNLFYDQYFMYFIKVIEKTEINFKKSVYHSNTS